MKQKNIPLILSLLIITIYPFIAYFLFIPFLGFYNDDWLFSYLGHFFGPNELIKGFSGDRPLVGYLFAINHLLFKENILLWHFYMFIIRILGGYILFFLLRRIWPDKLYFNTSITLLFLIYPGFLQQIIPLGDQNYFTALTVWISSIFFTVVAIQNHSKILFSIFTLIAIISQIISYSLVEIFIGMEIFRLLLIHYTKSSSSSGITLVTLKKNVRSFSPYVISLILFILWRVFIFKSIRTTTNIDWITQTYYSNPEWLAKIPLKVFYSFISTVLFAYFVPIIIRLTRIPLEASLVSILIGIISSVIFYWYHKIVLRFKNNQLLNSSISINKWGKTLLFIGLISVFSALIFVIVSGRYVSVLSENSNFDRYTISSIAGVVFIIIGFLVYKTSHTLSSWVIILLTSISITTHFMNNYWYKLVWDQQKNIWWQLYWRSPQIQKNALLAFDYPNTTDLNKSLSSIIYKNQRPEDYLIWAPGNLFFNYLKLPTDHFSGQYLHNNGTELKIRHKISESILQESSTIKYTNNFSNTIIISLPNDNSCLWILDNKREELPENASNLAKSNITYSDTDKLLTKDTPPTIPPTHIFGKEPSKTSWCYYFQKASLFRQLQDWDNLNKITAEVLDKNLKPKDPNEWLPFIEGLLISKKYNQAKKLIQDLSNKKSVEFTKNICKMIHRLKVKEFQERCNN